MLEKELERLETQVDALVEAADKIKRLNSSLQHKEAQLTEERADLMRKNDIARNKVEAMISRLRSLEHEE